MISVREGIGYRVMGDYMAYWHEVYTEHGQTLHSHWALQSHANMADKDVYFAK